MHIVKGDDIRFEVECAAPEENRSFQIEVEPQFKVIGGDAVNIFPAYINIKIRFWSKNFQRITGKTISINRIIGAECNSYFQYFAGRISSRTKQRINAIA